ncbi:MAG: ABC transporter substrate-binding protein [Lachnospiraceae bacterium]|nr:ABC transporter substrate-binding protein [Lachnospiraceae bacterium]
MWKRSGRKMIFIWFFIFAVTVLLSARGAESEETSELVFGIDYSEELGSFWPEQVVCAQGNAWAITSVRNDFIYEITVGSGAAVLHRLEWQPADGEYFLVNIAEQDGTLYAELFNQVDETIKVRKYSTSGIWSDVVTIKPEGEDWHIVGSGFFVDSSGNIYLVNGSTVACFDKEGEQTCQYQLSGTVCFFQESSKDDTECVVAGNNSITLYALKESGAEERWTWEASETVGQVHGIGSSEEGLLCLATDQEILYFERESGGLWARTELVELGVASVVAGHYDAEEGTLQLYEQAGSSEGLSYHLLSERDESEKQRTELVYGMVGGVNADTTSVIWNAITTFNQQNEAYYVTIKYYDNNLDRLHADMTAGNGPDIIDMTYSEYYESYVKNGYLEDLTPYLEQSQYSDDIIWNVLDAYKTDGGLYMFVPQFVLKGILIHPDYESMVEEWNMETFLKLLEENQWEMDLFDAAGDPENLLRVLLYGRQEEFLDWENGAAYFDTGEFTELLELCMEYAQADWSHTVEWTYEERERNTLYKSVTYGKMFAYYLFYAETYGREYPVYGYPTLSGQAYGLEACSASCAIYSLSGNKEGAWEFIESLLWESNQKYSGLTDPGFPVRKSVLEELAAEAKDVQISSGGELLTINGNEISILTDIIYNGSLSRTSIDPDVWAIISEETAAYFVGEKSAEDVAQVIQSRVWIILQE